MFMEGASWPKAVEKGRSSQGERKPEKQSPSRLNRQETGEPRAHSPVLAAWPVCEPDAALVPVGRGRAC